MRSEKHTGRLALALLFVVLLVVPAYTLTTENIEIIWTIPGDTALKMLGLSLASGDVNGDGVPDLAVGSYEYCEESLPRPDRGRVDIYYGGHVGDSASDLVLRSPCWSGSSSPRLACGDLNGDGYADIAVGEDGADGGGGICTIFMGGDPMDTVPDYTIRGESVWWLNSFFGHDVSIGDVNGDGYGDLVVGAYGAVERPQQDQMGRVYVFCGGHGGVDTIPDVILKGGHDGFSEGFGTTVSAEGDFDHDGFHDIFVGAWQYGGFGGTGRVYVYYGGNPMDTSYAMAMSGEREAQCLGVDKPGALNAQGSFDYAIQGHELWPHGIFTPGANCGKVYVWQGGRPMDSVPDVELVGRVDTAELGYSAQSAGDASGDGTDDLIGGAPYAWPPSATGAAYLWETGSHFDTVPDAWMMGDAVQQVVGERVCMAGDIDGDGRSEFLVSNYTCYPRQHVWVCKYTGSGVEEDQASVVRRATALRAYPSPCRERVLLSCSVCTGGAGMLRVYDATGRAVRTLDYGPDASNGVSRTTQWDLRDNAGKRVGQGVYVTELEQNAGNETRRHSVKVIVER